MGLKHAWLVLAATALLLTACGEDTGVENGTTEVGVTHGTFEDGTYELVEANYDENGWRAEFTIDVEDGEIVTSNYNEYNEQGTAKTEDESYQEAMADQAGIGPQEYMDALNGQLVETQDAGQVDTVSGATSSSEKFQEYAAMLLNAAENGETDTLEVDNEVD